MILEKNYGVNIIWKHCSVRWAVFWEKEIGNVTFSLSGIGRAQLQPFMPPSCLLKIVCSQEEQNLCPYVCSSLIKSIAIFSEFLGIK